MHRATGPVLTSELLAAGYSANDLARLRRSGELLQLRRGAYTWESPVDGAAARHRQLVLATVPMLASTAVVSHVSAAVLHGLPVWDDDLSRVHVTRDRRGGARRDGVVHVHAAPLPVAEVVTIAGVRTTSMSRTVVDLARSLPLPRSVSAGDAALRSGLAPAALSAALAASRHRPGMAAARRVLPFLDGRSESPGESLSRLLFAEQGLPAPALQFEVRDSSGALVGRTDFCWEEHRTLGEFDGKVKYRQPLRPGQSLEEVLYQEKRREDALRDLGWQLVRWSWADLDHGPELVARILQAFRRGGMY